MSTEHTYSENLTSLEACERKLEELHEELLVDLNRTRPASHIRKIFVKLRFADFSRTTAECVSGEPMLERYLELLEQAYRRKHQSIRLMGLGVRFAQETEESRQLKLSL